VGIGAGLSGTAKAVFFDRDGVLNEALLREGKPYPPESIAAMKIVDGAAEYLARLKELGFLLLVVTNQPDVARGTQSIETVQAMHRRMAESLPIDEFLVCPHDDRDGCLCRKPAPGMLLDAQRRYGIDLGRSFLVGDRWRDVQAGHAAGCRTVFLDFGYRERRPPAPEARVASLREAVEWIVQQAKKEE
jgi:D-glycero-D-manno-heptose 1,7-bisphosphate phosphatase